MLGKYLSTYVEPEVVEARATTLLILDPGCSILISKMTLQKLEVYAWWNTSHTSHICK